MAEAKEVSKTGQGPAHRRSSSREGIPPLMAGYDDGQNRRQTAEGNTDTQQELLQPAIQTQNVLSEITGESVIVPTSARTYGEENPGTTVQSIATEQERSSPAVQSQVQERERPSESVKPLAGESTQTSERTEDRRQTTQQKEENVEKNCRIM